MRQTVGDATGPRLVLAASRRNVRNMQIDILAVRERKRDTKEENLVCPWDSQTDELFLSHKRKLKHC